METIAIAIFIIIIGFCCYTNKSQKSSNDNFKPCYGDDHTQEPIHGDDFDEF